MSLKSVDWRSESSRVLISLALTSLLALAINCFVVIYTEIVAAEERYSTFDSQASRDTANLRLMLSSGRKDTEVVKHGTERIEALNQAQWWSGDFLKTPARRKEFIDVASRAKGQIVDDIGDLTPPTGLYEHGQDPHEAGIDALKAEAEIWLSLGEIMDSAVSQGRTTISIAERGKLERAWMNYQIKHREFTRRVLTEEDFNKLKQAADDRIAHFRSERKAGERRFSLALWGGGISTFVLWIAIGALLPKKTKITTFSPL